ncbi:response regulator transcription factor [Actinokineospora cianjurensis]|uniref:response regulator transcription factor n=1 Tax=Actinokineospora cianjurensis TaxID=585224 RepID=UPI003CCC54A3
MFRADPPEREQIRRLPPGERAVLEAVARGATTRQAARQLGISPHTAKNQLASAHQRLGARNRAEAVGVLYRSGWRH